MIEAEEVLLDRVHSWSEGMLCPSLEPLADDDDGDGDGDEEEEEDGEAKKMKSDVEVMGKDVVLALMQMNFLQRLRLEYCIDEFRVVNCFLSFLVGVEFGPKI